MMMRSAQSSRPLFEVNPENAKLKRYMRKREGCLTRQITGKILRASVAVITAAMSHGRREENEFSAARASGGQGDAGRRICPYLNEWLLSVAISFSGLALRTLIFCRAQAYWQTRRRRRRCRVCKPAVS